MNRNPIENFRELMSRGRAGWMPFTLDVGASPGFTPPALSTFREQTGEEHPEEYFDYDFRAASLTTCFGGTDPAALHPAVEPGTVFDEWGIGHWAGGAAGTYEKSYPPLASAACVEEIEALPTPRIEIGDTPGAMAAYQARGYPVMSYAGSIYEWSWWLRGMQEFMMDLLASPELAEAVLQKVTGHTQALALASARAGSDVLCFYDDAGMQSGLQIAPELWREFIKPRWRDVLEAVRAEYPEKVFFLHSCGKIDAIIPDIVELGFHILHPIQPECMDFREIRQSFGRDIVLCATISAQKLFPFGTPEEVRAWVRSMKQICAADHAAILCPSNRIQPETPWENIVAFAEEAHAD